MYRVILFVVCTFHQTCFAPSSIDYDKWLKDHEREFSFDENVKTAKTLKKLVNEEPYTVDFDAQGNVLRIDKIMDPFTEEAGELVYSFRNAKLVSKCDLDHFFCSGFKDNKIVAQWDMQEKKITFPKSEDSEIQETSKNVVALVKKILDSPPVKDFVKPSELPYKQFVQKELVTYMLYPEESDEKVQRVHKFQLGDTKLELSLRKKKPAILTAVSRLSYSTYYFRPDGSLLTACEEKDEGLECHGFKDKRIVVSWNTKKHTIDRIDSKKKRRLAKQIFLELREWMAHFDR